MRAHCVRVLNGDSDNAYVVVYSFIAPNRHNSLHVSVHSG
jgi:hypothetical protein